MKTIDIKNFKNNPEALLVYDIAMKTKKNVVVDGIFGTGKSELLLCILKNNKKGAIILDCEDSRAGFGVQSFIETHSTYFPSLEEIARLKFSEEKQKIIKNCKLLLMENAGILSIQRLAWIDKIFKKFKRNDIPFGGVQVIYFCNINEYDFYQHLKSHNPRARYFFESFSFMKCAHLFIELKENYLYKNKFHIDLVNSVRKGDAASVDLINKECFHEREISLGDEILLTNDNEIANKISEEIYDSSDSFTLNARHYGRYNNSRKAPRSICVGLDSKVMFIDNVDGKFQYGDFGTVEYIDVEVLKIRLSTGSLVIISPQTWASEPQLRKDFFYINDIPTLCQYPIRECHYVHFESTIKSLNAKMVVDSTCNFDNGGLYNILSKARSIECLRFEKEVDHSQVNLNQAARDFLNNFSSHRNESNIHNTKQELRYI